MKSLTYFIHSFINFLIVVLLLVVSTSTQAQNVHYRDPYNPAKGYWKLYTDAATRTTSVKFFDVNHHQVYEEVIPEKYVKLTDRNINKINEAFDQVTRNHLIQAKVKSNALPLGPPQQSVQENSTTHFNHKKVNARAFSDSGIILNNFKYAGSTNYCVLYKNPERKSVNVSLIDEQGKVLYSEYESIAEYRRVFDFRGLYPGVYTLTVATSDHKYKYTEQLTISPITQNLQVEPANSNFLTTRASNF
ncbi:hypothetical protein [Adhaeribacter radiodurans]|uniref:T9SS type A sorting domain-containing protein n=1 Tax=Adhaeribacter radiodurans TaxID=2745197 RepID=A0A7L7LB37_9BACT|nr:hypothetical protein [Adhaeribacter radiodurans]QMU30048.1 hypothetical protein HUW48_19355 [Adhaeribacter radiodurans]